MERLRAVLTAVAATAALTCAPITAHAGSPLSSNFVSSLAAAEAVPATISVRAEEAPVSEPVSTAFLGIGISSLITFRRFRKLFN